MFTRAMMEESKKIHNFVHSTNHPMVMTENDEHAHSIATNCHICKQHLGTLEPPIDVDPIVADGQEKDEDLIADDVDDEADDEAPEFIPPRKKVKREAKLTLTFAERELAAAKKRRDQRKSASYRVRDHDHLKFATVGGVGGHPNSNFRGSAHQGCNLMLSYNVMTWRPIPNS